MPGETPSPVQEKPRLLFDAESVKRNYAETRREKGDRYFAYMLGTNTAEANAHAQLGMKDAYTVARQQAGQELLSKIKDNQELMEIYQTSYQLRMEDNKIFNALSNEGPKSEAEKEKLRAELDRSENILDTYEKQILAASRPAATAPEQLPPLPRVCIEATRYQIRDQAVPESHTHSCSICSGK
jgi:hypothetical protein